MITVVVLGESGEAMKYFLQDAIVCLNRKFHTNPERLTSFNIIDMPTSAMEDALMYGYPKLPREFTEATERLLLAIDPSAQGLLNQLDYELKRPGFTGKAPTILQPHNAITKYCRQIGLSHVWLPKAMRTRTMTTDPNLEMRLRRDGIYCPLSQDDADEITRLLRYCVSSAQYGGQPEELRQGLRKKLEQMAQRYNFQAVLLDHWAKPLLEQRPKSDELPLWLDIYKIYAEAACDWVCNTVKSAPPRVPSEASCVLVTPIVSALT